MSKLGKVMKEKGISQHQCDGHGRKRRNLSFGGTSDNDLKCPSN